MYRMERQDSRTKENGIVEDESACFPGEMGAPLFAWPWQNLGIYKYLLYGTFVAKLVYSSTSLEGTEKDSRLCEHVLHLCILRGLVHQLWSSYNAMLFLNRTRRVSPRGIDFKQIDREWDWDNFIILQSFVGALACLSFPSSMANLPMWNTRGLICCVMLHVGLSEPIYYWGHRFMHSQHLFTHYHWLHHSSRVTHPFTAGYATFLEHILMCVIVGLPIIGTILVGFGSISMIYGHVLIFDFLRCLGHCNVEIIPHQLFDAFPLVRYFIYTPTYHSLHHTEMGTNFCLFMPLYDALGNTINRHSWHIHKEISSAAGNACAIRIQVIWVGPIQSTTFLDTNVAFHFLGHACYVGPVQDFLALFLHPPRQPSRVLGCSQYFLPFAREGINKQIEEAILRADRLGVKVLSLAALNKNEALNRGGTLFVNKHPNLKVRVVHGNTLTAAVILHEIPKDAQEVFLAGSTSKLGRAIALYLARRKVAVMMLTQSTERFKSIQKEAPIEYRKFLVQVTTYQAAEHCKIWIIGKWTTPREQWWAPAGTHFYQFVVPPIIPMRRDCTYGKLAALRLPDDVEELGSCEYKLERGVVHACHAGGVVHLLEGWTHHEVGAIDVDQIDVVWNAALKHGFKPL
ncbi:hypothetical protein TEA_024844 [Camellia sinensis var. sinensis]|uniref:Fatty acid hydroxylase domain-containing protein n=1 Tax=Camellia sinensis var. sinensis TaxID=542762 RepID=A0A4S4EE30_CAMSN|nr:hypothetical protein TEA_024844 [Camellia sinensis var. sinensis]